MGVLVQGRVSPTVARQLDRLANVRGCSRATYVARLVEMHVRALKPTMLRAMLDGPVPRYPASSRKTNDTRKIRRTK